MDHNDNKNPALEFVFERHEVFSSFNESDNVKSGSLKMKKVKKAFSRKGKKSRSASANGSVDGSSPGTPTTLERTESQASNKSVDSLASSSSYASSVQQREYRQSRILEEWMSKFGYSLTCLELANQSMQLFINQGSKGRTNEEIEDIDEEFSRWEDTVQNTLDFADLLMEDAFIDTDAKKLIKNDVDSLTERWKEIKSLRFSTQITRFVKVFMFSHVRLAGRFVS
ncbi:uncharacterized protein LOC135685740 [Rhopilema esculentum]|uniref:uncharacterized protein LOC135685740 n=1 Tax=Rhopilema esculentum TaxID=499914 RepID=UPI0031D7ADBF